MAPALAAAVLLWAANALEDPWLEAALETARWLESVGEETRHGLTWPADTQPKSPSNLGLYSGAPGVVLFFLEAHAQPRRAEFLETARRGADDLVARWRDEVQGAGLYTGLAGVGFTLAETWRATGADAHRTGANEIVSELVESAVVEDGRAHWSGGTDIVSGNAGVGLFLLYAHRVLDREDALATARRAGDDLVRAGRPVEGGTKWP